MIDSLFQDVRYTIRTLRASPGFALGVILTLALGIGANSTIFSLINAALLHPLPYPDADRIVSISTTSATSDFNIADEPSIARWIESARGFDAIAAYRAHGGNWTDGSTAEYLRGAEVTSRFFGAMGVAPAIGRGFTDAESRGDAGRVVILGNGIWRRALGGDRDVLGRNVRLDGLDFTVIGIMPLGFEFPRGAQYWTPLALDPTADSDGTAFYSLAIGRLAPGVSHDAGRAELEAIRRRADGLPASFRELGARVIPLQERLHGDLRPALLVLLGVVGCVLLIACAIVANLLLARATVRRRELAFRIALGASRGRIVRQLLVESAVLALAGGALGLLIPAYGLDLVAALGPAALTRVPDIGVDGTVLGFTLGVSLLTGILFGLAPAVAASGADVRHALKDGSGAVGGGRGLSRLLAGRDFTSADRVGAPPVAIVSESMARLAFPDGAAIGRTLAVRDETYTVVGVAAEARQRPGSVRSLPIIYLAEAQQAGALRFGILALHSRSDPTSHLPAIRDIVRDLDSELALHGITTLERELAASRAPRRFQALLVGTFAALALILAAAGLYALIAYLVARRTREIGVRVALGARRGDVVRLVLEDGALPVAFGVGLGLAGAFALTRLIENQLFGVAPTDPVTFVLVPVGLATVALAASWLPARQAARVDPMTALRQE